VGPGERGLVLRDCLVAPSTVLWALDKIKRCTLLRQLGGTPLGALPRPFTASAIRTNSLSRVRSTTVSRWELPNTLIGVPTTSYKHPPDPAYDEGETNVEFGMQEASLALKQLWGRYARLEVT
jgi:hypothetical protein